jgi:predicted TIM-barrel fold metal-dependent hydrolase
MSTPLSGSVIDLDVSIGLPAGGGVVEGRRTTAQSLLEEMDRLGIDTSVVFHIVAREHAPRIGNELLLEEIAQHPRLMPAFTLLPPHTGELPDLPDLVAQMTEHGVRFTRIFPSSSLAGHRFALREWCIGTLLDALEECSIALGVDFSLFRRGEPPWDDIVEICTHHPDLRIALMDVQGRNNRNLYALLDRFENLYVSSGGLNVHAGLEDLCARFGAERVFFGSGTPRRSAGAARFVIERSGLNPAAQAQVLGDTARLLLGATSTAAGAS